METNEMRPVRAPRIVLLGLTLLACSAEQPSVPDATGGSASLAGTGPGGSGTGAGGHATSGGAPALGGAGSGSAAPGNGAGGHLGGGGFVGGGGLTGGGSPGLVGVAGSTGPAGAGGLVGSFGGFDGGGLAGAGLTGVGSATGEAAGAGGNAGSAAGSTGVCGSVTVGATFAEVTTILTTSCGTGGCHPSRMGMHVDLHNMDGMLHTRLLGNVPAAATMEDKCLNRPLVVACKPEESLIMAMIGAADGPRMGCGVRMPDDCPEDDNPCLPDAEIEKIRSWIAAGALP